MKPVNLLVMASLALVGAGLACSSDDSTTAADAGPVTGFVDEQWFAARALEYIRLSTEEVHAGSLVNAIAHMGREGIDEGYLAPADSVLPGEWDEKFEKISSYKDTSDFEVLAMVYLLTRFDEHPYINAEVWQPMREVVLDFKYWFTDPVPEGRSDDMWYWTENHQCMFHVNEYLAGQKFKDDVFVVTGMTGAEHQARAREFLLDWFETVSRFGFREFHSNVYYSVQLSPLMALAELAEDEDLRTLAYMTIDLMLFDMGMHTFRATFGSAHGRSYKKDKTRAMNEDTYEMVKFLFDTTEYDYNGGNDSETVMLALHSNYRPPQVLLEVGRADGPFVDRERLGLLIDENAEPYENPEAPFGLDYTDHRDLMKWWGASALTPWQILPGTIDLIQTYNLWENAMFDDLSVVQPIVNSGVEAAVELSYDIHTIFNFGVINQVNSYTYRTPDYMLASGQNYRSGLRASQAHTWQATFDAYALVFTTHPGGPPTESDRWKDDESQPAEWTGTATCPYTGQFENVAIHLYSPHYAVIDGAPFDRITAYEDYTHAFFPQEYFDEVTSAASNVAGVPGSWTFGRLRDGYIGLYSMRPTQFVAWDTELSNTDGMVEPFDLRALGGPDNVWIVEMGSASESGDFESFKQSLLDARIEITRSSERPVDPLDAAAVLPELFDTVEFESPSKGLVTFGWNDPLVVDGTEVQTKDYLRYDNPWAQTEYDPEYFEVVSEFDDTGFRNDFKNALRKVW